MQLSEPGRTTSALPEAEGFPPHETGPVRSGLADHETGAARSGSAAPFPPHADVANRYRPAPTSPAQQRRYVLTVGLVTLVMLVAPALLVRMIPDVPEPEFDSSEDAFSLSLETQGEWSVEFGALDHCDIPEEGSDSGVVHFHCPNATFSIIGMSEVQNQPLAVNRSIRAMNFADLPDMRPKMWTKTAHVVNPKLREELGAQRVWITDYYFTDDTDHEPVATGDVLDREETGPVTDHELGPDEFTEKWLSRTISFYRGNDADDSAEDATDGSTERRAVGSPGQLISVQVSAWGVDEVRSATRELLASAKMVTDSIDDDEPETSEELNRESR